jgi:hypothetical protein
MAVSMKIMVVWNVVPCIWSIGTDVYEKVLHPAPG